jgi:anti-anti-sigma factor
MNLDITPTIDTTARSATLRLSGALDYLTTTSLVQAVTTLLAETPGLRDLRLDTGEMTFCDSAGLSGLIQAHRQTAAAGIQLHLDNRLPHFDRLLDLTGVLEYLTAAPAGEAADDELYEGGGSNN